MPLETGCDAVMLFVQNPKHPACGTARLSGVMDAAGAAYFHRQISGPDHSRPGQHRRRAGLW